MTRPDNRVRAPNPYTPPRAAEHEAPRAWVYSHAAAMIAAGVALSVIWDVYVSLLTRRTVDDSALLRIAVTIALWAVPFAFLVRGARWARRISRVLSALIALGSVESLVSTPGSALFYAMCCLRMVLFALAVLYLRPSSEPRP
jgi:hypothetical protein